VAAEGNERNENVLWKTTGAGISAAGIGQAMVAASEAACIASRIDAATGEEKAAWWGQRIENISWRVKRAWHGSGE